MKLGKPREVERPRVRYAKSELAKLLTALERADDDAVDAHMRVIELERALAEEREAAARWRRSYEALRDVLSHCGANGDLDHLDQVMRAWVAKA